MLIGDLVREITAIWQTDELRCHKPTPVDEARAGLHIVEQSLWKAVPHYLRRVSSALKKHTGSPLPLTCTPIEFGSWMGGDRDGNPNVTAKVTKDVSLLSRWMAIDLYIREIDNLSFEMSVKRCNDKFASLANEILLKESASEDLKANTWNQTVPQNNAKIHHSLALPAQLPSAADLPSCTECSDGEYQFRIINLPRNPSRPGTLNLTEKFEDSPLSSPTGRQSQIGRTPSGGQLRKLFKKSHIGRSSSFRKLLEPSISDRPGITPCRVVLGNVKEKLVKTCRRLELLLEDLPCDYDTEEYCETSDQLLEPLFLCYQSLQSCGSSVLADDQLADLIRRVATFGMVLMKLDVRQESGRHTEALDAVTSYLDLGVYSEWDEEKKLDFLTRELKGKRPLVPPNIEFDWCKAVYGHLKASIINWQQNRGKKQTDYITGCTPLLLIFYLDNLSSSENVEDDAFAKPRIHHYNLDLINKLLDKAKRVDDNGKIFYDNLPLKRRKDTCYGNAARYNVSRPVEYQEEPQGDIVLCIPSMEPLLSSSMEKLPPNFRSEINSCMKKYHLLTEKLIKEHTKKIMAIQSDMAKELRLLLLRAGEQVSSSRRGRKRRRLQVRRGGRRRLQVRRGMENKLRSSRRGRKRRRL